MSASKPKLEGVVSLLDTDLYKLTMQCAVLRVLPELHVTYAFTNRTPHMKLGRRAYDWLLAQINSKPPQVVCDRAYLLTGGEQNSKTLLYPTTNVLGCKRPTFRFRPREHIRIEFKPISGTLSEEAGDISLSVDGLWVDTILYEIPLLSLISEAYFKYCDTDWSHEGQEEKAYHKGATLLENGCIFSEFGTRRRRDYETQDMVIAGLVRAAEATKSKDGKLSGTSNVHLAMKYDILPVGTMAHEWFMGIAASTGDYKNASETALRYWVECFGRGVLGIALTDTFGTPAFLNTFRAKCPGGSGTSSISGEETSSYAQIFTGIRQDSGDPKELVKTMRRFYNDMGIKEKKTVVFSDSLNTELCLEYKKAAEDAGFQPTFGIGTFLTNDFVHPDGNKSVPLNIVIKLSSAAGHPAVKISDNVGKNTGNAEVVQHVKEVLGYVEKTWSGGDEKTRWGSDAPQPIDANYAGRVLP